MEFAKKLAGVPSAGQNAPVKKLRAGTRTGAARGAEEIFYEIQDDSDNHSARHTDSFGALAIALIYFKKRNVSGLDEFPYAAYSASPDSLRGNRYVLEAQMDVQLANVEGGRVVAALGGREGFPVALSCRIPWARTYPPSSATLLVVRVGEGGRIIAESMEKY